MQLGGSDDGQAAVSGSPAATRFTAGGSARAKTNDNESVKSSPMPFESPPIARTPRIVLGLGPLIVDAPEAKSRTGRVNFSAK